MSAGVLTVGDVDAVRLGEVDLPALERLCAKCAEFFELIEGQVSAASSAAEILGPLDPEYAHGRKHVWGVRDDGELIAIAELLQGHPDVHDWYIGLLLLDPAHRRKGLGARFTAGLLDWIASLDGSTVRLVVQRQNPGARTFWQQQGFEIECDVSRSFGRRDSVASVLVCRLECRADLAARGGAQSAE